jgi:hypothetical protein
LVRSILVCFESVFIRVALGVQSDFVMRVYIPSRSVVSSFMRGPYFSVVQHNAQHESREQPSLQLPGNSVALPDTIKVSKHCPRFRCASSDFALSCCVWC